jgi:hypothetical protein
LVGLLRSVIFAAGYGSAFVFVEMLANINQIAFAAAKRDRAAVCNEN